MDKGKIGILLTKLNNLKA